MAKTRIERPYATACEWMSCKTGARQKLSRVRRCWYRRISKLPGVWGRALDDLGAPLYVVRWVAVPGDARPMEREKRYRAAKLALEQGRLTRQRWRELRESCSTVARLPPAHRLDRALEAAGIGVAP